MKEKLVKLKIGVVWFSLKVKVSSRQEANSSVGIVCRVYMQNVILQCFKFAIWLGVGLKWSACLEEYPLPPKNCYSLAIHLGFFLFFFFCLNYIIKLV
jgi:hypothetical protein